MEFDALQGSESIVFEVLSTVTNDRYPVVELVKASRGGLYVAISSLELFAVILKIEEFLQKKIDVLALAPHIGTANLLKALVAEVERTHSC